MLEKMDAFFEVRLEGYDAHMLQNIEGADEFYPFTADQLPVKENAEILDLGCGTGLELEYYFRRNPTAAITGIDLSRGMLSALRQKFPEQKMELIVGSYFDVPLETARYDAAVSVESLHHFTQAEKIPLYTKVVQSLKPGGYLILTDYFAEKEEQEQFFRQELARIKAEEGITDGAFYHYDTPLTVAHETEALLAAGFREVNVLRCWEATCTLKAWK